MIWFQKTIDIIAPKRGFILITEHIYNRLVELENIKIGTLHLYIKHTSASLTVNENADSTVRDDLETYFNKSVPESKDNYTHTYEGLDDMPAHIKSTIIGNNITIPITDGKLNLGTWQGIYLCEHRDIPTKRTIIATLNGTKF